MTPAGAAQSWKLPVHRLCADVTARGSLERWYCDTLCASALCDFMWSATLWLSCCGFYLLPRCNNTTYSLLWNMKEGRNFTNGLPSYYNPTVSELFRMSHYFTSVCKDRRLSASFIHLDSPITRPAQHLHVHVHVLLLLLLCNECLFNAVSVGHPPTIIQILFISRKRSSHCWKLWTTVSNLKSLSTEFYNYVMFSNQLAHWMIYLKAVLCYILFRQPSSILRLQALANQIVFLKVNTVLCRECRNPDSVAEGLLWYFNRVFRRLSYIKMTFRESGERERSRKFIRTIASPPSCRIAHGFTHSAISFPDCWFVVCCFPSR